MQSKASVAWFCAFLLANPISVMGSSCTDLWMRRYSQKLRVSVCVQVSTVLHPRSRTILRTFAGSLFIAVSV